MTRKNSKTDNLVCLISKQPEGVVTQFREGYARREKPFLDAPSAEILTEIFDKIDFSYKQLKTLEDYANRYVRLFEKKKKFEIAEAYMILADYFHNSAAENKRNNL